MTDDKDLHNKVRDAIFLAALGSWEESCTFEELSEDGKQVYEGYATAALEALKDELALIRNQRLTDNMQAGWDALGLIRPVPADLPFCIRSTKKPRPGEEARLTRIGRSSRAAHWR